MRKQSITKVQCYFFILRVGTTFSKQDVAVAYILFTGKDLCVVCCFLNLYFSFFSLPFVVNKDVRSKTDQTVLQSRCPFQQSKAMLLKEQERLSGVHRMLGNRLVLHGPHCSCLQSPRLVNRGTCPPIPIPNSTISAIPPPSSILTACSAEINVECNGNCLQFQHYYHSHYHSHHLHHH